MAHGIYVECGACERGEHYYCTMARWCMCENEHDGDASRQELDEYWARIEHEEWQRRQRHG